MNGYSRAASQHAERKIGVTRLRNFELFKAELLQLNYLLSYQLLNTNRKWNRQNITGNVYLDLVNQHSG